MMRPATLAAVALGFLTAFAVGQLGLVVSEPETGNGPPPIEARHSNSVAEAFYAGVNAWIATGDRSLERLLAPDFVDHTRSGAPNRNSSGLFEQLDAIGATVPSLHFEIVGIEAGGTTVSIELLGRTGQLPTIDGWSIDLPTQSSFREILRIEEGQVAERWSSDDLWPVGSAPVALDLPHLAGIYSEPAIQRFTFESESAYDLIASGTIMLWVESGELRVELSGRDQAGKLTSPMEPLLPGAIRLVEPTGTLRVQALGSERAELWAVSLDPLLVYEPALGSRASSFPSGVRQDASVAPSMRLPANGVRFLVHIVTLPVGATLSTSVATLHEVGVVGGALRAHPEAGETFYCFDRARSRLLTGDRIAMPEQGFATTRGGAATFQVTGSEPATLLLVSIQPADWAPPGQPIRIGPG